MAYSTKIDGWHQYFYNYDQAVIGYQLITKQVYNSPVKGRANKFEHNLDFVNHLLKGIQ